MADSGKRFSVKELTAHEKSGALDFLAGVGGYKDVADLREHGFIHVKGSDVVKYRPTYFKDGDHSRATVKVAVKKLSKEMWTAAVANGFAGILAQALGHVDAKGAPRLSILDHVRGIAKAKTAR